MHGRQLKVPAGERGVRFVRDDGLAHYVVQRIARGFGMAEIVAWLKVCDPSAPIFDVEAWPVVTCLHCAQIGQDP